MALCVVATVLNVWEKKGVDEKGKEFLYYECKFLSSPDEVGHVEEYTVTTSKDLRSMINKQGTFILRPAKYKLVSQVG